MDGTNGLHIDSILPPLRQELQIIKGPRNSQGACTWTLHDPANNRFFRLGWRECQLLASWCKGLVSDVLNEANQSLASKVNLTDIEKLFEFLYQNELLKVTHQGASQLFDERHQRLKKSWMSWLTQHYLFLRIPLLRPDQFLTKTYPYIRFLFSRVWFIFIILLSSCGVFLITRQLDSFIHTFSYLFSFQGMAIFIITLGCVKIAHEFGHAYACIHYGVRVPSMGVAFMVFWPVLYTDATDAWRLNNKQSRATIAIAGVMVELAIAGIAAFCWSFLPDGVFKTITFIIATTTWLFSLAVNLNPFMRFDGYYLASDYFDIPNLQPRSFALARWWLREKLFGLDSDPPEQFTHSKQACLIIYAICTWLYRLILFLGIAVLVYKLVFKVLGILLFIIEIYYLIVLPIVKEMTVWWQHKALIPARRKCFMTVFMICIVSTLFIPWNSHIVVPALVKAKQYQYVYPASSSQIKKAHIEVGDQIKLGDTLFELHSPSLDYQLKQAKIRHRVLQFTINRYSTTSEMIGTVPIIEKQLAEVRNKISGLQIELAKLIVNASFAGKIKAITEGLKEKRWVNKNQQLALLVNDKSRFVEAYVREKYLPLVKQGNHAVFYPEDPTWPTIKCVVTDVELIHSAQIQQPYLASTYGGEIPVRPGDNGELNSEYALFKVRLSLMNNEPILRQVVRGSVVIETEPHSIIDSLMKSILQVIIRETQF